jgi:hypothetical protein
MAAGRAGIERYRFSPERRADAEASRLARPGRVPILLAMLMKAAALVRVDFAPAHRQPSAARVALATLVSIIGSLLADALCVVIAQAVFPGTRGYPHFQFTDYVKLTVIGVLIACAGWPVTTRVSSQPRWLFSRMAILVTLVLLPPDFYIMYQGQPGKAVAFLFLMHIAIALVTYNALVRLAPIVPFNPVSRARHDGARSRSGGAHRSGRRAR